MLLTIFELITAFVVFVYIAVIVYTYLAVFLEARNQRRRLQTDQLPEEIAERLRKKNEAVDTLAIILTALLFSYIPTVVLNGYAAFSDDLVEPHVLYVLSTWSFTFLMLGSLLNPLIYR